MTAYSLWSSFFAIPYTSKFKAETPLPRLFYPIYPLLFYKIITRDCPCKLIIKLLTEANVASAL